MKLKVGIFFGGNSKEREVSFAGGRTVYDNLNKSLFDAVPVFVDSFGNFVLLEWQYIYKGSIRDFYPPVEFIPSGNDGRRSGGSGASNNGNSGKGDYQIYAENLGPLGAREQEELIDKIGSRIYPSELNGMIDFAFLCLHGSNGEDGRLQGLLEYLSIPYSGSGILPSSIGMNKSVQKELMVNAGFASPAYLSVSREEWDRGKAAESLFEKVKKSIGFPLVIKPANQGSSIGVSILHNSDIQSFTVSMEKAYFNRYLYASQWNKLSSEAKLEYLRQLADIREGIGFPLMIRKPDKENPNPNYDKRTVFYHPDELASYLDQVMRSRVGVLLESAAGESHVLIEEFIEGREFSCIVLQDENKKAIALPPTEIRKGKELFDYRSKYLPGLSRKITPIDLPADQINELRKQCERLFYALHFDVYARIDGFIRTDGRIFLNDPNTTSGMMPSSFFFHQAAEIGLNPSQFLTYIIRTSLSCRIADSKNSGLYDQLLVQLDKAIEQDHHQSANRIRVAVLFGGYSSERHISVESGRNVFEKLASSSKYEPLPVFLTGSDDEHKLYSVPINLLLKDNADDIKEKAENYSVHPVIQQIIDACAPITAKYAGTKALSKPRQLSYTGLKQSCEVVFIALHGRPGEDGAVQRQLDKLDLPYNGSDAASSKITIDKYTTNEILRRNGFLVARHMLVSEEDWQDYPVKMLDLIKSDIHFPFIAKPVDDGCSSAVRKIKTPEEFSAFAKLIFRKNEELDPQASELLHLRAKEEFPIKKVILVEELIAANGARHFLEITGGMLTSYDTSGHLEYQVFEASEALSEGEVLSLEEKFLAGQGQNITPARYSAEPVLRQKISDQVKKQLGAAAKLLNINGYTRIDAFVRIFSDSRVEVIFIEVNSLPGMTPATCIFHQSALQGYKPYEFIDRILDFAFARKNRKLAPR